MKTNSKTEAIFDQEHHESPTFGSGAGAAEFAERVLLNQRKLSSELKSHYDFIVCGSGSSGSVVARRLAENPDVSVLLLEAGGSDGVPSVREANQWPLNLGTEQDWSFQAQPNPHLNGRVVSMSMGKVLGGGSSINAMAWARGHKNDWDYFAAEAGDPAWNYESVLKIYRRIEDWHGTPDPDRRGTGGLLFIQPAPDTDPIVPATLKGARSVGIPTFDSSNGCMMEGAGGCALPDTLIRNGQRLSIFRSYTFPYMDRPNLTVLTDALVTRLTFSGTRAASVEIVCKGKVHRIGVGTEVVLSLGAIHTPKLLMQSGIGDQADLQRFGIPLVQHLPGVGQNFQDHVGVASVWEILNKAVETSFFWFWKSDPGLDTPNMQAIQTELPFDRAEKAKLNLPPNSWWINPGVVRPKSRGHLRLTGAKPLDPLQIEANILSEPDDLDALMAGIELCRQISNSAALRPFVKREVMPGDLKRPALENFVRNAAFGWWHQSCTAKMGCDPMSVVDSNLKVYGIENLRIADASVMPRVTTGNTMAPCVIIGERAAEVLRAEHRL
jgi:choline dehydrogenase